MGLVFVLRQAVNPHAVPQIKSGIIKLKQGIKGMATKGRDWTKLYQQYRGKWVALAEDRMTAVASGESRREVKEAAVQLGHPRPLVLKFPEELTAFAG